MPEPERTKIIISFLQEDTEYGKRDRFAINKPNGYFKEYFLPDEYIVKQDECGVSHIYSKSGNLCPIVSYGKNPAFIDSDLPIGQHLLVLEPTDIVPRAKPKKRKAKKKDD